MPSPARGRPRPFLRALFRAPVTIYRWRGGWLLGHRFLLLRHFGRRTGRPHDTVLEVLRYDPATSEATVISGFGRTSDWLRNLDVNHRAEVMIGHRHFPAEHRILPEEEAVLVVAHYERRNRLAGPVVRLVISRLLGWPYTASDSDRRRLVSQLPLVALRPRATSAASGGDHVT